MILRSSLGAATILAILSCKGAPVQSDLTATFDTLGFFRYSAEENRQAVTRAITDRGWSGIFADQSRLVFADAEDLAEGGFGDFFQNLAPVLTTIGVRLPNVSVEYGDQYLVTVGPRHATIWTPEDLARDSREPGYLWGIAAVRTFQLVNDLLIATGTHERLYAVYGGNDLHAFFLTPELYRLITTHPDALKDDLPYTLTAEYPWFGQPH